MKQTFRRLVVCLTIVLVGSLSALSGGPASASGLTFVGCVGNLTGCVPTKPPGALDGASQVAVSGTNLYVTANQANAVSHFNLSTAGAPIFKGCVGELSGCRATKPLTALGGAAGVTATKERLYVAANSVLNYFRFDSVGNPVFLGCIGNLTGCKAVTPSNAMTSADRVAVRGRSLYVTGLLALNYFALDTSGNPTFAGCIGNASGCTPTNPSGTLNGASGMAFSGTNLYVAASFSSDVSHFRLSTTGVPTFADCIGGTTGCTATNPATALTDSVGVAVSGQNLYATSTNNTDNTGDVSHLTIAANGDLSLVSCIGNHTGCTAVVPALALNGAHSLTAGVGQIYAGSDHVLSDITLDSSGNPTLASCIGNLAGCATTSPATALESPTTSLSSSNLYAAASNGNDLSHLRTS